MAKSRKKLEEWKMEEFSDYFDGNERLFGNSKTFNKISGLAEELYEFENEKISKDMLDKRTEKLQELIDTAIEYDENHVNPHTPTGKERKKVINAFKAFCEKEKVYVDSVPSINLKFFEGSKLQNLKDGLSYEQIKNLESKLEEIREEEISEDKVIEYTNTVSKYMQAIEIYRKNPPEDFSFASGREKENIDKRLQEELDFYKPCIDQMRDLRTVRKLIAEGKSWDDLHALREATAEMTGKEAKVGANASQRFKITHNGKTGFFTEEVYAKRFMDVFDDYMKEHHETKEDIIIAQNRRFFEKLKGTTSKTWISFEKLEKDLRDEMKKQDRTTKEGQEYYQACQELMNNPKAKGTVFNLWKKAGIAHETGEVGGFTVNGEIQQKGQTELSRRNVATSRMAELLGIGTLIAHSEKMTVNVNGKNVSGCFMEFAEGADTNTKDVYELINLDKISLEIGGSFSRDASNLQLFDTICAQEDRHGGNMFLKLGEPDEKGVRKIIGLQGIDNDLAFSRKATGRLGGKMNFENIVLVDEAFAKRINALSRDKVEYAVGDLLNSADIDAIMKRIDRVREHINDKSKVIRLETEADWKLDKYSADMDISKLDKGEQEYAKRYINAVNDVKNSQNPQQSKGHIEGRISDKIKGNRSEYQKLLNEENKKTEFLDGVSKMFEQAEQDAKTFEKVERARENRPKERMSFKDFSEKSNKKPAFKTAQPSQNQKEKKSVVIGANRGMGKK